MIVALHQRLSEPYAGEAKPSMVVMMSGGKSLHVRGKWKNVRCASSKEYLPDIGLEQSMAHDDHKTV